MGRTYKAKPSTYHGQHPNKAAEAHACRGPKITLTDVYLYEAELDEPDERSQLEISGEKSEDPNEFFPPDAFNS